MNISRITINNGTSGLISKVFYNTTSGNPEPSYPCDIILNLDKAENMLQIEFEMINSPHLKQNNYTADNSAMWNQEVFEIFISAGAEIPIRYLEIQLNPNGALFSAWVNNPNGKGSENTLDFINGHDERIETSVIHAKTAWQGCIKFPLSILGPIEPHYRLNFFRIVSLQSHNPSENWACTAKTCHYLSWSPINCGSMPVFHLPVSFGQLDLA